MNPKRKDNLAHSSQIQIIPPRFITRKITENPSGEEGV
jgi:hypothetical protein